MDRWIIFDVDSTLLRVESLDFCVDLAYQNSTNGAQRIAALKDLTDQGMSGQIDFRTSLDRRLELANLSRHDIEHAAQALREHLTAGMADLITDLQRLGDRVMAVSGGFMDLIIPSLNDLGIENTDIYANQFVYCDKQVIGFETENPLSQSGGKAQLISALRTGRSNLHVVMVGDGITDYNAYSPGAADQFIGFGGVCIRETVRAKASDYALSVDELMRFLIR